MRGSDLYRDGGAEVAVCALCSTADAGAELCHSRRPHDTALVEERRVLAAGNGRQLSSAGKASFIHEAAAQQAAACVSGLVLALEVLDNKVKVSQSHRPTRQHWVEVEVAIQVQQCDAVSPDGESGVPQVGAEVPHCSSHGYKLTYRGAVLRLVAREEGAVEAYHLLPRRQHAVAVRPCGAVRGALGEDGAEPVAAGVGVELKHQLRVGVGDDGARLQREAQLGDGGVVTIAPQLHGRRAGLLAQQLVERRHDVGEAEDVRAVEVGAADEGAHLSDGARRGEALDIVEVATERRDAGGGDGEADEVDRLGTEQALGRLPSETVVAPALEDGFEQRQEVVEGGGVRRHVVDVSRGAGGDEVAERHLRHPIKDGGGALGAEAKARGLHDAEGSRQLNGEEPAMVRVNDNIVVRAKRVHRPKVFRTAKRLQQFRNEYSGRVVINKPLVDMHRRHANPLFALFGVVGDGELHDGCRLRAGLQ